MEYPVLDHGYIKFIAAWGSDQSVIEAARMSTDKGFQGWGTLDKPGDEKLLEYLYNNKHMSPFEMGGLVVEVQAPIFVFREWHRHRTQSYNELSARYTPIPDINYLPAQARCLESSKKNKQAGNVAEPSPARIQAWLNDLESFYLAIETFYQRGLQAGVPKEIARVIIPVGRYSRMRASANLRNWLAFLTLRDADNAQWEIRQYAKAVASLVEECFPRTYALYANNK